VIYQEIPLVDQNCLDELRSMDEDGTFISEIVSQFVTDSATLIGALSSSIAANDLERMAETAHRLNGSATSLGAKRIAALASDIEHDSDLASLGNSLARLELLRTETIAELSSLSSQHLT
jgi:HPt (histidine-containing phosphotransfer) domain-containing protein